MKWLVLTTRTPAPIAFERQFAHWRALGATDVRLAAGPSRTANKDHLIVAKDTAASSLREL